MEERLLSGWPEWRGERTVVAVLVSTLIFLITLLHFF